MNSETSDSPTLKQHVLERIRREGVCPRSRWIFVGKECVVWGVWVVTLVIAAVAVAISLFVIMQRQYDFYEATHENFLSFLFEVLPYLWFSVFIVSAALALYHFRHTKHGYRYPLWVIAGSSVLMSLVGGVALHYVGMSFVFDKSFGHYLPGYWSQEMMEKHFWQRPQEGRLIGVYMGEVAPEMVLFRDVEGVEWYTNIEELFDDDVDILRQGKQVRLLGGIPSEERAFHACGVFLWMYDRMMTHQEVAASRKLAIERLQQHRDRNEQSEQSLFGSAHREALSVEVPPGEKSECGDIAAVKRLRD